MGTLPAVLICFAVLAVLVFLLQPRERDYLANTQRLIDRLPAGRMDHFVQFFDATTPESYDRAWQALGGYNGLGTLLMQMIILVRLIQLHRFSDAIQRSDAADIWSMSLHQIWATLGAFAQLPIYPFAPRLPRAAALTALRHHCSLTLRVRTLLQVAGAPSSLLTRSALL